MYKLLLSWRYLRTRFIALASIVSVTLGVATMIVVNSVMAGFVSEMKSRLHGILSDVEIRATGLDELQFAEAHIREIEKVVGDDLKAVTCVVQVPGLLSYNFRGKQFSQPIALIGVDQKTFSSVCEFNPFLLNENNQKQLSFQLHENGYAEKLGDVGWGYRRDKEENRQAVERLMRSSYQREQDLQAAAAMSGQDLPEIRSEKEDAEGEIQFNPLPDVVSNLDEVIAGHEVMPGTEMGGEPISGFDPHSKVRPAVSASELFNPTRDQYTGIIMGLAISNRKMIDPEDNDAVSDVFLVRPGDDVQLNLFTAGAQPTPIAENFTVVDFYSSNMHEYDSNFCFVPLDKLQKLRGMIDPMTGEAGVSGIQIRLREGANLDEIRDKLIARFPPEIFPYVIQTWQDTQRPLLSAVNMELTILNILLFLIIAVAGFGILATFFMIVVEKTRDIGVLKALGAPSSGVMSIFLGYGVSLGAVGTGVGILLGLLFVWNINAIADLLEWASGREVFDPTIYYFSEIPTQINPMMVVSVAFGAIMIAVLASVLPALRAARLHPVEALRNE